MKFAHVSDCHLGAWHDEKLKSLNLQAFLQAMERCHDERVDFVLVTGDLFHTASPDLDVVQTAVSKMRQLKENGAEIYLISGSHDSSPNSKSIADVLSSSGFIKMLGNYQESGGKITPEFVSDPRSGALITGLAGKRKGDDAADYARLDRIALERQKGFKVFAFHNYVEGIGAGGLPYGQCIALKDLPRDFNYYAGGHTHTRLHKSDVAGYPHLVYAGALFGSVPADLEEMASGMSRGFYLVSATDQRVTDVQFCEVRVCDVLVCQVDVEGLDAEKAKDKVQKEITARNIADKVMVLKIAGRLAGGRPYQLHLHDLASKLSNDGALTVVLNTSQLAGELPDVIRGGKAIDTIERGELQRAIQSFKSEWSALVGENGVELAHTLLDRLAIEQGEGETKRAYEQRLQEEGQSIIDREVLA